MNRKQLIKRAIKHVILAGCLSRLLIFPALAEVQYVKTMPPARIPQITYWFCLSNTVANAQYLNDVRNLATNSPYTLAIMTARSYLDAPGTGLDFYDYKKMHEPFAQTVRAAHQYDLKIGLQIWEPWSLTCVTDATRKLRPQLPASQAMALVTEGEVVLDASGHATYSVTDTEGRDRQPFQSEVLKVFAFRQTGDGYYARNSLTDITASAKTVKADASGVTLAIDASTNLAGNTAYILVAHYYDYPDLFNNVMADTFHGILEHYADIPFDGTALDEFGWMMLKPKRDRPFRDRIYGQAFAAEFRKRTGTSLAQTLFDMRYAPAGEPGIRIRAINEYFDVMRDGPLRGEKQFYKMSKDIFGPNTFAGIHNTYHNHLTSDDIWRVGLNYWTVPREYGQSDENWLLPERMGLIVAHSEPVTFDQFYGGNPVSFLKKAFGEARFGGRTDYLAWNDPRSTRVNMADMKKYSSIREVELKIRLLNQFKPAAPKLSVLVVFGMPALLDWFPNEAARSAWDINGTLEIEQTAMKIWQAGYPCALLPSDLIDDGQITFDDENRPVVNGHRFDALVFLYPQYAKETTLKFLESYTKRGGKLMLEGKATYDFRGQDIATRFQKIAGRATVNGFDLPQLSKLGAQTNSLENGAFMEDGSVVFTDFSSWQKHQAKPFRVTLAGHEFSGNYLGVCALKTDQNGDVEKFAGGGFKELKRDGQVIFSLEQPADAVINRVGNGSYNAIVVSSPTNRFRSEILPAGQTARKSADR
jgi:hypothetical protein